MKEGVVQTAHLGWMGELVEGRLGGGEVSGLQGEQIGVLVFEVMDVLPSGVVLLSELSSSSVSMSLILLRSAVSIALGSVSGESGG
eukprot:1578268-Ditylum_brightwellii.AAC.1